MLVIDKLCVKRGDKEIVKDFSLTVEDGEIVAVLGRNGAGKSTLAGALMGLSGFEVVSGKIELNGKDITNLPVNERAKLGLTMAWQEPARFEGIKVKEYIDLTGQKSEDEIKKILHSVGIPMSYLDRAVDETLSGGERKRIELASVVAMNPKAVILDEPDSGIDFNSLNAIKTFLDTLKNYGASVILITHQEEVAGFSDKAVIMCQGVKVKEGKPDDVIEFFKSQCEKEDCYDVKNRNPEVGDEK